MTPAPAAALPWTPHGHCGTALPAGWVIERFTVQLPVVDDLPTTHPAQGAADR
ncbi:hypothetical protein ACFRAQ_12995 [Nocardia sp. NPDC056611]|uniref:hypothetical protein n=1 Tax=Nocardia sp. NPDC056611 TaxID=3345877 RepID=UPI0036702E3F